MNAASSIPLNDSSLVREAPRQAKDAGPAGAGLALSGVAPAADGARRHGAHEPGGGSAAAPLSGSARQRIERAFDHSARSLARFVAVRAGGGPVDDIMQQVWLAALAAATRCRSTSWTPGFAASRGT